MAISRKPQSGRKKRQALIRQQFIQTAHTLLIEVGREKLSLREVARRTDYSPAALYEYFDSKQDLIDEIAKEVIENFAMTLQNARQGEDPVTNVALAYVEFAREHHSDFLLVFGERRSLSEHMGSKIYQVFVNTLAFEESKEKGDFARSAKKAYRLWIAVHGLAMLQITHFGGVGNSTSYEEMGSFVTGLQVRP